MGLVLKRKSNQGVMIGDDVYMEVHKITKTYVSLRFVAPSNVRIIRCQLPPLGSFIKGKINDRDRLLESDTTISAQLPGKDRSARNCAD